MIVRLKVPKGYKSLLLAILLCQSTVALAAKIQKPLSASVQISASPEAVFQAIQKSRESTLLHRKLLSYDGKVARIKENLEGVPIYGKVECVWEETEFPVQRIEYKMLSSDKFKSGSGTWIITRSADNRSTNLELQSYLDTGLRIPFAGEITKMGAAKDSKLRLQHIKEVAESSLNHAETGAVPKK